MIIVNGREFQLNKFPDGSLRLSHKPLITRELTIIRWNFESNEELVALMFLVRHMRDNGVKSISLEMPYVPNARQDRVKDYGDVFTLKYFCEVINSMNFSSVIISDPHSYVTPALINNVRVVYPISNIVMARERVANICDDGDIVMFYPDEGAMKRYSRYSNGKYAFGIKNRDWATGKIMSLDVAGCADEISGKNILIVDDICSRGGTFTHSAAKLKELGANRIFLYVTHCENTIEEGTVLSDGLIERVFTTDSILTINNEKIEVL